MAQSVKRLPQAQVMIPGSGDEVSHRIGLPALIGEPTSPSPSASLHLPCSCALSLSK